MSPAPPLEAGSRVLVVGYGLHGRAVTAALDARGHERVVVDDQPSDAVLAAATGAGVALVAGPGADQLRELVEASTHLVPTPGLHDRHPVFELAAAAGVPVISELDLARQWDQRPLVAVTGTNGKTTVTTLITRMLVASGRAAITAGNMEVPLVTAIDDPTAELFVVEASSFRLGHSSYFAPAVGTWLNFDPDHLDVHRSLDAYEAAKARIWAQQGPDQVAVANADDPVVMRNLPAVPHRRLFGVDQGDARVADGCLSIDGTAVVGIDELARSLPHDIVNGLAAAVTAEAAGATLEAMAGTLRSFTGLPHRVQLVGEAGGVRWYDDSKATTPHAVIAGVGGFDSAVLVAGGRNKGVDLSPLRALTPGLRAVVAIGEAAGEVAAVFAGEVVVRCADSMGEAVTAAAALARPGDAVVLSPACTSYDWYESYVARGDDFARLVAELVGSVGEEPA